MASHLGGWIASEVERTPCSTLIGMTVSWFRVNQQSSADTAVSDGPPEQAFAAHIVEHPTLAPVPSPAVCADGGAGPRTRWR
jgi:hypothetical protein